MARKIFTMRDALIRYEGDTLHASYDDGTLTIIPTGGIHYADCSDYGIYRLHTPHNGKSYVGRAVVQPLCRRIMDQHFKHLLKRDKNTSGLLLEEYIMRPELTIEVSIEYIFRTADAGQEREIENTYIARYSALTNGYNKVIASAEGDDYSTPQEQGFNIPITQVQIAYLTALMEQHRPEMTDLSWIPNLTSTRAAHMIQSLRKYYRQIDETLCPNCGKLLAPSAPYWKKYPGSYSPEYRKYTHVCKVAEQGAQTQLSDQDVETWEKVFKYWMNEVQDINDANNPWKKRYD